MKNIVFIPTMKCNLNCDFCHYKKSEEGWEGFDIKHNWEKELTWQEWLNILKPFEPYFLEITGGEPLMYEGFKDLINNLPKDCRWAITSNTLIDVDGLDLKKCVSWTASYHNNKEILENLNKLRKKVYLRISFVALKDNINKAVEDAYFFKDKGFRINILREFNKGVVWDGTPEWETLKRLRARGINVPRQDIPASYNYEKGFICGGGFSYFCAMPDGKIFRCFSDAMLRPDKPTELKTKREKCSDDCIGLCLDNKFRRKDGGINIRQV